MRSRTQSSIQNILYSLVGQGLSLIISFILRMVFVRILTKSYLGVDSLFTSLVTVLSLAELGIGSAINFSLYEPLAKGNINKVKVLMKFYKKAYTIIGIVVFILGLCMLPFINQISNVDSSVPNLKLLFLLFVVNSSISYFYSYKKSLVIADQYRYITVIYSYASFIAMSILQALALITFHNYVFYLLIMIFFTFLQNFLISKKADQMYPYLKDSTSENLDKKTVNQIIKNSYAMSLHKIGGVVVNSTDSVIISHFAGIRQVGKYSNYLLITNALNLVFSQIFTAIIASVGNLGVEKDSGHVNEVFDTIFFMGFWLVSFSSCCLFVLFNPFISIWIGNGFTFSTFVVAVVVLNFYIYQIRRPVLTFRDAMGIYWYDRYVPIVEAVLNLSISIFLTQKIGIAGALMGTIISSLMTNVWIEPLMLFRHGLRANSKRYYVSLLKYSLCAVILIICTNQISTTILNGISNKIIYFIMLMFLTIIIYNCLFLIFFFRDRNFKSMKKLIISVFRQLMAKFRRG